MTIKEKADALVKKHILLPQKNMEIISNRVGIILAILSVEHTIEVLNNKLKKLNKNRAENEYSIYNFEDCIKEQTELLTELKSRL